MGQTKVFENTAENIEYGFIVHAWMHEQNLRLAGRLESGESFAALIHKPRQAWFIADSQNRRALPTLDNPDYWEKFQGHPMQKIDHWQSGAQSSGLSVLDEYLLSRSIRGPVQLLGPGRPGRRVDKVFVDPELRPAAARPGTQLVWAALDIETDRQERVLAVSLAQQNRQQVWFVGEELHARGIKCLHSESELLQDFAATLRAWDPDIISGWNVIDFDLRVLAKRFAEYGLPFDLGRAEREPAELRKSQSGLGRCTVPGRQVLDALRIVRGSGQRYEDQRLETVARAVLGRGKLVSQDGDTKLAELDRLHKEDPISFCRYCQEDSHLVLDILSATGLDKLTQARASLTGSSLELAWTSIPAFERVYALELLKRQILPPRKELLPEVSGAAGGTVLEPIPGYFHNVLVFDFRSLYPSIMRTFNIDPLVYQRTEQAGPATKYRPAAVAELAIEETAASGLDYSLSRQSAYGSTVVANAQPTLQTGHSNSPETAYITAPNGARFGRQPGILPELLAGYFADRQAAQQNNDHTGAYVYKILMNSFYGVLGSGGCVYGRSELAGAITGFGRMCLHFARDWFRCRGMTVLYGDTDSVFIYSGAEDRSEQAAQLAEQLNEELSAQILRHYGCTSKIEIRFDTAYSRFLLPCLRSPGSSSADSETDSQNRQLVRGRAKGYAGQIRDSGEIQIKGMEAARSDYTALAQDFQTRLFSLLFADAAVQEIDSYVRSVVKDLFAGRLDQLLVYRKVLRRPAREYTANVSPQVRAARLLGWTGQRGRVAYYMTMAGAEPLGHTSARIDYRHYIEHQLRPVWLSIAEAADLADSVALEQIAAAAANSGRPEERIRLSGLRPLDDQLELGL
ncbi:MAG: DNA polymerase II [Spirochaetes bacterium]|nr:DNA polymerase II [Spirochaetota bacterium]